MVLCSGSLRIEELGPIVTLGNLTEAFPYDDPVFAVNVTGAQLKWMLKYMMRDGVWKGEHSEFYQLSDGLHVVYSRPEHKYKEFKFKDQDLDDDRLFTLGLQQFHYNNFENSFGLKLSDVLKNGPRRTLSTSCRQVIEEYFSEHQHLDRIAGDRLIIE